MYFYLLLILLTEFFGNLLHFFFFFFHPRYFNNRNFTSWKGNCGVISLVIFTCFIKIMDGTVTSLGLSFNNLIDCEV